MEVERKEFKTETQKQDTELFTMRKQIESFEAEKKHMIEEIISKHEAQEKYYEDTIEDLRNEVTKMVKEKRQNEEEFRQKFDKLELEKEESEKLLTNKYMSHLREYITLTSNLERENKEKQDIIDGVKNKYKDMYESYQKLLLKLKVLRDTILEGKQRIKLLESENNKLAVRAAIGFENLTPRPDLNPLIQFFEVEERKMTTREALDVILSKTPGYCKQDSPTKLQVHRRSVATKSMIRKTTVLLPSSQILEKDRDTDRAEKDNSLAVIKDTGEKP
jgi:DNA repair exonuclease SbcCD ATPase subunit